MLAIPISYVVITSCVLHLMKDLTVVVSLPVYGFISLSNMMWERIIHFLKFGDLILQYTPLISFLKSCVQLFVLYIEKVINLFCFSLQHVYYVWLLAYFIVLSSTIITSIINFCFYFAYWSYQHLYVLFSCRYFKRTHTGLDGIWRSNQVHCIYYVYNTSVFSR